jgi:uncharacterized membrane protein YidH (DUF202 family)
LEAASLLKDKERNIVKGKLTLPNILFIIFALVVIGLGVRKYQQNQEAIAKWDLEHAEETEAIRELFERMEDP